MEPVTVTPVTAAWTIAKTAGEISKKLYEFAKSLKDRDAKQQVEEMLDRLRELKHQASQRQTADGNYVASEAVPRLPSWPRIPNAT